MAEMYLFSLPDGRSFDTDGTKSVEDIRKAHPQARITHQAELDENGNFVAWHPFKSKTAEPVKNEQKTVAQLRAELEARGIEAPADAKKADLIALLEGNDGAPAGDGSEGQAN